MSGNQRRSPLSPASNPINTQTGFLPGRGQSDLSELARDLVDKVGIDGAVRYCRSLGWRGVLDQVEQLRRGR
jgi:hypothetical protein